MKTGLTVLYIKVNLSNRSLVIKLLKKKNTTGVKQYDY